MLEGIFRQFEVEFSFLCLVDDLEESFVDNAVLYYFRIAGRVSVSLVGSDSLQVYFLFLLRIHILTECRSHQHCSC